MDNFQYLNGHLCAEEVLVSRIAEQYGTPTYIYSRDALERAYLDYAQALEGRDALVCYAVKANANIGVLNVLARLGAGFDIVSLGELERVIKAGGDPKKVVFSGVAKREDEMRRALELGIHCFNVESEAELDRLNKVASELDKVAAISLRVNPDVDAGTHPYISTGLKDNKFGVAIDDAARIYAYAHSLSHLDVQGVDCHIGSQLTEIAPFLDALDRLLLLIDNLAEQGITIKHLDLGGGLGVCYTDEVPPTPQAYIAAVIDKLGDRPLKLIFEPGRSIAANAGILITRVEFLKCTEHKNFAIIDGAMNDLIRPALYSAYMDIIPVDVREEGEARRFDLVGPVCESGDFLGKDRALNIEAGDLLAVCSAGAYGFGMSSNYNTRNRAAEVMVDDNQVHLIRKRETIADQLRGEAVLPG
ncbi:diaminopimelate decarboxylase [Amphritea sp. 2_MG-2023]|uniref:diaminopimelate decarboxylase n=1 Tax=Amphritea TaxID=515417 RepID=UPI001C07A28B|nr:MULTISPECIES: diaminopimelate decarboxylase [Amphritea]MBU2965638.1 diaminopimelate decarboxylase [Amphritea atlantica]MDO6417194.1 diaminopimelate decarboxylase [Amphritea sp. 2_MG-2023]MDX2421586.1 diaminopimelate decarboxylase [Amphritea sp.]